MIQIITDTMSDIAQEEGRRHGIVVLPMYVLFGSESYLDGVNLSLEQFYEKLAVAETPPKTSQVSPESFQSAFEAALARGDEVLCIIGSSKLSGSYQSANIARATQPAGAPIFLIDSLGATASEQILVWEAARLRDAGESAAAIAETLTALVSRVEFAASVKDLKHLVMGGRLSATSAYIGGTLSLRPMLRLVKGKLEQAGLARGKKRSFDWFQKQLDNAPRDENFPLYLASSNAREALGELQTYLEKKGVRADEIRKIDAGSIIGSHAGQGAFAIAWVRKA